MSMLIAGRMDRFSNFLVVYIALILSLCSPASAQETFSNYVNGLPAAGPITGAEYLYMLQSNASKKSTINSLAILGSPLASSIINVTSQPYGASNTGNSDASAAIQSAVNAAAEASSAVYLPCGTYLINSANISLPSNVEIYGAGWCSVLKAGSALIPVVSGVLNTNGTVNITIRDLAIDLTAVAHSNHAIFLQQASAIRINRVSVLANFLGGSNPSGDGIAAFKSNDVIAMGNRVVGVGNACYDQWGGSSDVSYIGNYCNMLSAAGFSGGWGLLVTGANTDLTPATTVRAKIIGNTVLNAAQDGIWIQGGWNGVSGAGSTLGSVANSLVEGNTVDTVTTYHGIEVSDSVKIIISGNTVRKPTQFAILAQTENGGNQTDLVIVNNVISNCASGRPCVELNNTTDALFSGNRISGDTQTYDMQITSSSGSVIATDNLIDTGTIGRILDQGLLDQILDTGGSIWTIQNPVGPYFSFTNTTNNRTASYGIVDNFNAAIAFGGGMNLNFVSGNTTSAQVNGNGFTTFLGVIDASFSYQNPSNNFSIVLVCANYNTILDPLGSLSSGTVQMCSTPSNGQISNVTTSQAIASLAVNPNSNQSILGAPTSLAAGAKFSCQYRSANSTWYC